MTYYRIPLNLIVKISLVDWRPCINSILNNGSSFLPDTCWFLSQNWNIFSVNFLTAFLQQFVVQWNLFWFEGTVFVILNRECWMLNLVFDYIEQIVWLHGLYERLRAHLRRQNYWRLWDAGTFQYWKCPHIFAPYNFSHHNSMSNPLINFHVTCLITSHNMNFLRSIPIFLFLHYSGSRLPVLNLTLIYFLRFVAFLTFLTEFS
jgi:hypothetical protein